MRIMVLSDGETYTSAEGCLLLDVRMPEGVELEDWHLKAATDMIDPGITSVAFQIDADSDHREVEVEVLARFE